LKSRKRICRLARHRKAARIDENQPKIVEELRKRGMSVEVDHDDILVGYRGKTYWFEIKDPEKALSKKTGKINDSAKKKSQKILEQTWKGHYRIVHCIEQILEDINHE